MHDRTRKHAYGAPISDEGVTVIGAYLAVNYGSAKATDAELSDADIRAMATFILSQ